MRPHCLGHIVTQAPPPPSPGHRIDFLAKAFYKSDLYIYIYIPIKGVYSI